MIDKSLELHTFSFDQFVEGFVAELVSQGVLRLRPNSFDTTEALSRACNTLEKIVAGEKDVVRRRQLQAVFNQLRPDHLGTFDYFLAALRSKQLGFVSHHNPSYKELTFQISPTYAQFFLRQLPDSSRKVLDEVCKSFLAIDVANA